MEITLDKIDQLRKRANVSYKEAKEALERNEGNIVEALAELEEADKIKPEQECTEQSFWQKTKRLYVKWNNVRFVVYKEDTTLLNFGIPLALLVTIVGMHVVVPLIILALITGCRMRFIKNDGEECEINKSLDNIANKASDIAGKVANEFKNA